MTVPVGLPNAKPHDPVNSPAHYTSSPAKCIECGRQIECIHVTEHMGFCLGNVFKYLWRADEKGTPLQDLRKAAWYLAREIAKRGKDEREIAKREGRS